jgi:hypothetical protein
LFGRPTELGRLDVALRVVAKADIRADVISAPNWGRLEIDF